MLILLSSIVLYGVLPILLMVLILILLSYCILRKVYSLGSLEYFH